jgi:hypothetical protein
MTLMAIPFIQGYKTPRKPTKIAVFKLMPTIVMATGKPTVERLGPDRLRGRGRSIGGDLDIGEEGSEQNLKPLQSLYYFSVGYQSMQHKLTSPRRLIPASAIENTSKNEEDAI